MASQFEQHVFINPNRIFVFCFYNLGKVPKNGRGTDPTFKWTPPTADQGRDFLGLLGPGQEELKRKCKKTIMNLGQKIV